MLTSSMSGILPGLPRRVLIVEDEPLIGMHLKDLFERAGIQVVWVQTDRAAYVALNGRGRPFEVALLDVDLGRGTTGFDVARHARKANPQIGIVFSSGSPPEWVPSFGVPDAVILPKPCTETAVLNAVARAVAMRPEPQTAPAPMPVSARTHCSP